MVLKILGWDYSGSTGNVSHYFETGRRYIDRFIESSKDHNCKYLIWDSSCEEITIEGLNEICDRKEGNGGTEPSNLVQWILNFVPNEEIELWLITDGEIYMQDLSICAELNSKVKYASVKFIIINNTRTINLSVGAAFFNKTKCEIYRNLELIKCVDTSIPFNYDNISLGNYDEIQKLSDFIQGKFMASDAKALEEIDKLNRLKQKLLNELQTMERPGRNKEPCFPSKKKDDILSQLETLEFYKTLTNTGLMDKRTEIDGTISTLVNYFNCENKSFEFQNLRHTHKTNQIELVQEENLDLDSLENIEKFEFFDAVSFEIEKSRPMLFLNELDLIKKYWQDKNYSNFRRVVDCPLFADVSGSIGHVYSIETFTSLRHNDCYINPLTNQTSYGGLIFGNNPEIHKWNDYIISFTYFRGKKVTKDLGIWYYVIWKEASEKAVEWIKPEIINSLKEYAFNRLESACVRLGFSSLPMDPKERVPVPIACYYCTEGSSKLFGEHGDLFLHERLRMFYSVSDSMLEILEQFGYTDIDTGFVKRRAKTFVLINQLKRIPKQLDKQYWIMEQIFQKVDNRFLTFNLKPESDPNRLTFNKLAILKYGHKEVIPFDWDQNDVTELMTNIVLAYEWEHKYKTTLCPQTFRPFFGMKSSLEEKIIPCYSQILECVSEVTMCPKTGSIRIHVKPVRKLQQWKLYSLCKLYVNLTAILNRFPNIDEFKDFVAKEKMFVEGTQIFLFSSNIVSFIENIFQVYENIHEYRIDVRDFICKSQGTVNTEIRVTMEKSLGNTADADQITKFVQM